MKFARLEMHVIGPRLALPPTDAAPSLCLDTNVPEAAATSTGEGGATAGWASPLVRSGGDGSSCNGSFAYDGPPRLDGCVKSYSQNAATDEAEMTRGMRREETRRRAAASLAIMADRARPPTWKKHG
jgi:hypothetical protein